ncbi:MAG TPA: hypothetical protein VEK84_15830 [Terriglobales bacterium]|nr:hypothetical protein [Terriglobales bacterium]
MTSRQPHEPRVGIFWLRNGKLITDFTPVSEAIAIRLGLGHAAGHIEYWTALQERGVISIEVEYEEPPRGRVGYNAKKKEFSLLAGLCTLWLPARRLPGECCRWCGVRETVCLQIWRMAWP